MQKSEVRDLHDWYPCLALVLAAACHPAPPSSAYADKLKAAPQGYVTGTAEALVERGVFDRKDFTWAIDVSRAPAAVAFTHLSAEHFTLGLFAVEPKPKKLGEAALNDTKFDVEAVAFSPDGSRVAVGSRDGTLRLFRREDAARVGEVKTDEPLTSVAFSPEGAYLAAGSARGLVSVFRAPELRFATELRPHTDEVRALAFDGAGQLFSGGWDKSVAVFAVGEQEVRTTEARVRFERRGAFAVFRGSAGPAPVVLAYDARSPFVTLTAAAAARAGIDVPFLKDAVKLQTPTGPSVAKLAKGVTFTFKALEAKGVDVVVCDSCAPEGADGVLGESFFARFDVVFDEPAGEVVVTAKSPGSVELARQVTLTPVRRLSLPLFVNDFTIDRAGKTLGVAFGEERAVRTYDLYKREKAGLEEPPREGNVAAAVDATTGEVRWKFGGHKGVVSTAAISPDGRTLASGGWDKQVFLHRVGEAAPAQQAGFGWSIRRLRFSPDGRFLGVAAWTPQLPTESAESEPAAVVYEVRYRDAAVAP